MGEDWIATIQMGRIVIRRQLLSYSSSRMSCNNHWLIQTNTRIQITGMSKKNVLSNISLWYKLKCFFRVFMASFADMLVYLIQPLCRRDRLRPARQTRRIASTGYDVELYAIVHIEWWRKCDHCLFTVWGIKDDNKGKLKKYFNPDFAGSPSGANSRQYLERCIFRKRTRPITISYKHWHTIYRMGV